MSTVLKDNPKIDRLSQLPPELLDDIFDLAAVSYKLCIVPPSKDLRAFHEKALYRYLSFGTFAKFKKFAQTLSNLSPKPDTSGGVASPTTNQPTKSVDVCLGQHAANLSEIEEFTKDSEEAAEYVEDYPTKVTVSRNGTMFIGFSHVNVDTGLVKRVIFQLELFRIEFAPSSLFSAFLHEDAIREQFSTLHVLVLHGVRRSSVVTEFSQMPSLRYIEFHDISFMEDDPGAPTASQVTHISILTSQYRTNMSPPLAILSFFPSATIVKLDLRCFEYSDLRSLLNSLTPGLRTLRLTLSSSSESLRWQTVDDLLHLFPNLRELHLSRPFLSHDVHKHILLLPHLVELSLVLEDLNPDFAQLLVGSQRLPYLQELKLEFVEVQVGKMFNLEDAISEIGSNSCSEDGNGTALLDNCHSVWEMYGWRMPFNDHFVAGLNLAEEMERIAKKEDIKISTNLESIRQAFRRQLVEYHNRGIGRLFLYMDESMYEDASRLADLCELKLPVLEIDVKGKVERDKLEWFIVQMKEIETDRRGSCNAQLEVQGIRRGEADWELV